MKSLAMLLVLVVSGGLIGAGLVQAAPIVTTLNTNMTRYRVNVPTNAELAFAPNPWQSDSLAQSPAGTLYSIRNLGLTSQIFDVTVGPIPLGPPITQTQVADLVYGNGGLWGFSNASKELFFFDLGTSAVTYSQVLTGTGTNTITGVAYQASTGDIYLSGNTTLNTDKLFRVPSASSAATLIGAMTNGDALSYFADIEFDATGTLYAVSWFNRYFHTVSTSNAVTTLVSMGPHRDVTAMAFAVPEPASLLGLAWGGLLLIRNRRKLESQAPCKL